jgi:outer membrane protein
MKNGIVIWNVVLTLLAGYLLFAQFSKKEGSSSSKRAATDSLSSNAPFRIAYFEMDSIEAHFDMVRDVKSEIEGKEKEYSNNLSQLDLTYRKRIQEYQAKQSTMTQADYEKAQMDLKQLEDVLKGRKQDLDSRYQEFVTHQNLSLKKEIEKFIAEYNKDRAYAYIVANDPGIFYYKDTAYDITADVIKGLNDSYKKGKK